MDSARKSRPAAGGPCPRCGANVAYDALLCTSCAAWRPHGDRGRAHRAPETGRSVRERRAWLRAALLAASIGTAAAVFQATRVLSAARPAAPPAAPPAPAPAR